MQSLVGETSPGKPGRGGDSSSIHASDERREWFTPVSVVVLDASKVALTDRGLRMLLILDGFCRDRAWCYPSLTRLATMSGRTVRWAQDTLRELESDGWIARVHGAQNQLHGIVMRRRAGDLGPAADTPKRLAKAVAEVQKERGASTKNPSCSMGPARRILHAEHEESCALSMKDPSPEEEASQLDPVEQDSSSSSMTTDDDDKLRSRETEKPDLRPLVEATRDKIGPTLAKVIEAHGADLVKLVGGNVEALRVTLARLAAMKGREIENLVSYWLKAVAEEAGVAREQLNAFRRGRNLPVLSMEQARKERQADENIRAQERRQAEKQRQQAELEAQLQRDEEEREAKLATYSAADPGTPQGEALALVLRLRKQGAKFRRDFRRNGLVVADLGAGPAPLSPDDADALRRLQKPLSDLLPLVAYLPETFAQPVAVGGAA